MSDTHKTLSDLFSATRNEPAQEFVTPVDAQRLVANASMRHVPSMWQRVQTRLLSTPLRFSMTAMTSAALLTLGAIGVRSLLSTGAPTFTTLPPVAQLQHQQSIRTVIALDSAHKRDSRSSTPSIRVHVRVPSEAVEPTVSTPSVSATPSVAPLDITPAQAATIGIQLADNGDINCYSQSKETGGINRCGLPAVGGVRLDLGERLSADQLPGIEISSLEPKLVTKPDGTKRLFTFNRDTMFESNSANGHSHYHMSTRIVVAPDDSSTTDLSQVMSNEQTIVINGDTTHPSSHARSFQFSIHDDGRRTVNHSPVVNGTHKLLVHKNVFVLRDSTQLNTRITDSAMNMAYQLLHQGDSNLQLAQIDTALHNARHTIVNILSTPEGTLISSMEHPLDLNKLIPLRVVNDKNPNKRNELIFWYEPTPEITNLLPAQKQSGTVRMAPNFSVSVYPNPTSGPAQISYTTKDASHHAEFVVRNLLGQKVLDAGSSNGTSGTISLDLSKLEAGLYLLVTTTDDGEQSVERIVVNK